MQKLVRDLILEINTELQPDDVKSTSMGAGGEDVMLSPAARKLVPFQIECKNQKQVAVYKWYDQAVEHGKYPALLIIKQNHREPLVILDASLFLKILRRYIEHVQNPTP